MWATVVKLCRALSGNTRRRRALLRPCWRPRPEALECRLAPAVTLSISSPQPLPEGDSGTSSVAFVVTRSGELSPAVQVHYATQDGTGANGAKAGSDYEATSGTLTLPANQTTATIEVPVMGNTRLQPDRSFTVLLSSPQPVSLFAPQQTFGTGSSPVSVALGDVNGDGLPDLIVANQGSGTASVLLNTTAAGASAPSFAPHQDFVTGSRPLSVALGDVNGDGRPDLLVANSLSNTASVLLNTTAAGASTPSFAAQQTFATGTGPDSVAVGDVNGDGTPDLLVANNLDNTASVLLNTTAAGASTPSFAPQQTFATGSSPFSVAVGDVNGDGTPDLLVANNLDNTASVLLNTTAAGASTPSFAPHQDFATGIFPFSVAVGDVNGDGTPDLLVANGVSSTVSVLLNTTAPRSGTASFAPHQDFATGSIPIAVALGDVNGDGRPDLLVANSSSNTASVLLNTTAAVALGTGTATGTIHDDDAPASVTPAAGNNQSAPINSPFATPLAAAVRNASGHLVQGVSVTFTAPAAGPGGAFAGSATVLTDAAGLATAPPLVANGTAGAYQVLTTASGGSNPSAAFDLRNDRRMPTITWASPADVTYGTALSAAQLDATADVPGSFAYSPDVGAILNAGTHTLAVTFTPTDTANYTSATASVTINVGRATPSLTWADPPAITYGTAMGNTQLNATASAVVSGSTVSVAGTFSYTLADGTTPAAGAVLPSGANQVLLVRFTPADPTNFSSATASTTINVAQATPSITWATPAGIVYGTALSGTQLNATADVPGTFTYTAAAGTVLDAGSQTLSVTFTPDDQANYTSVSADVTLTVDRASPAFSGLSSPSIVYGTATATLSGHLDAGGVLPPQGATVDVTLDGMTQPATLDAKGDFGTAFDTAALGAADHTVTYAYAGDSNFQAASGSSILTVSQASPSITWADPAAITAGTLLSAGQLNATASVPGTFAYTPDVGTFLAAGSHTLSVTFTPNDQADYASASASVTLEVDRAGGGGGAAPAGATNPVPTGGASGPGHGATQPGGVPASPTPTGGGTAASVPATPTATPTAPSVLAVRLDHGRRPRGRSRSLSVVFSTLVQLDAGAFRLRRGRQALRLKVLTQAADGRTVATLAFRRPRPGGNYRLAIAADRVRADGLPLAGATVFVLRRHGGGHGLAGANQAGGAVFRGSFAPAGGRR
jgi:hypothetical protein